MDVRARCAVDPSRAPWQCVLLRWGGIMSVLDLERACETALSADVEAFWLSASSSNSTGSSGAEDPEGQGHGQGAAGTSYGAGARRGMGSRVASSAALAQSGDSTEGGDEHKHPHARMVGTLRMSASWPAKGSGQLPQTLPASNWLHGLSNEITPTHTHTHAQEWPLCRAVLQACW